MYRQINKTPELEINVTGSRAGAHLEDPAPDLPPKPLPTSPRWPVEAGDSGKVSQ